MMASALWIANRRYVCCFVLFAVVVVSFCIASISAVEQNSSPDGRGENHIDKDLDKVQLDVKEKSQAVRIVKQQQQQQQRNRRNKNRTAGHTTARNSADGENGNKPSETRTNGHSEGLSPWSPWSKCNKRCRQVRHRQCTEPPTQDAGKNNNNNNNNSNNNRCAHHVLKQERKCRKGRCRREDRAFHVVLPPKRDGVRQPSDAATAAPASSVTSTTSTATTASAAAAAAAQAAHHQQSDVRVLLSLNSIFYSSWSRWSPCSKSCTTTRYRTCRFQVVCGNTVLHEEAYCYSKGTDCEKWYSANARQTKEEDGYEQSKSTVIRSASSNGNQRGQPRRAKNGTSDASSVARQECGISASGGSGNVQYGLQLRIIGGREATPGRWPWQVAILNRFKEAFCGGTLVGARWVLTAAHCLRKRLYVRIGEYDLVEDDGTEIDFRVEEVFVHPNYDPETVDNDVALLRLPEAINLDQQGIRLACLPQPGQSLPVTQKCTIIGWGKERSSHVFGTEVLHEAEVPIVKTSACREVYEDYFITENMFCAGYRKGRIDSCAGDSGGPLLCPVGDRWTIFGITSFGEGCGKRGKYGIYTKVPNYVDWIQRVISVNAGA